MSLSGTAIRWSCPPRLKRSSLTEWNNRSSRGKVACAIVIWRAGPRLHQRPIGSDPRLASGARHHGLCRHASDALAPVQELDGEEGGGERRFRPRLPGGG